MTIKIIQGNLNLHRELLIGTIFRLLTPHSDDRRFDWLYKNSPHGQARVWLAQADGEVIGVGAAFPRRYSVGHKIMTAWVLGDFCLDSRFRSLGPALALQRACLSLMESEEAAFCYDFPSPSMAAIYQRLKATPCQMLVRLARPLRVDRKVREKIPVPVVREMAKFLGNGLLRISRTARRHGSLVVSVHEGRCSPEFTVLAKELSGNIVPCIEHSAEYLNWRYLDNPTAEYHLMTARSDGRLCAYGVYTCVGEDGMLVDLLGVPDANIIRTLINDLSESLCEEGVYTLSTPMSEFHPWFATLTKLGFQRRESSPIIVLPSLAFLNDSQFDVNRIPFMQGDRDS